MKGFRLARLVLIIIIMVMTMIGTYKAFNACKELHETLIENEKKIIMIETIFGRTEMNSVTPQQQGDSDQ